ncbi:LOW QUALITY PROTEIN: gasdermin-B [Hipposideros larvatus]
MQPPGLRPAVGVPWGFPWTCKGAVVDPGTMSSVFEKITRVVVQEMDTGGDMIAVRSIVEADRRRCFCLVREKRNLLGRRYYSTDLTLEDILERGELKWHVDSEIVQRNNNSRAFHGSQEQRIQRAKTRISQQHLNSLENRKLKLPTSFQSIQTVRGDLYLVTETVKTARKETLKSEQKYAFWSQLDLCSLKYEHKVRVLGGRDCRRSSLGPPAVGRENASPGSIQALQLFLQASLSSSGSLAFLHQRAVTIPPKQVLGYGIKQVIFPNMETMNKQGLVGFLTAVSTGKSLSLEGIRNMKEKAQDMVRGLQDLTEEEQKDGLSCLTKCLLTQDEQLQDGEQRVSEVLLAIELQMESPAGPLLRSLFDAAGILVEACTEAILGFLDALMELSEEKALVAEALEKGTLPLWKEQVESTLEQNWGELPCDVDCDPEAQILHAVYVSASILLQLFVGNVASLAQVGTIIVLFLGEADQLLASGRPLMAAAGRSRWLLATHGSPWKPCCSRGCSLRRRRRELTAAQLQVELLFSILDVEGSVTGPHMWDPNRGPLASQAILTNAPLGRPNDIHFKNTSCTLLLPGLLSPTLSIL